jgi:hypothetical protein
LLEAGLGGESPVKRLYHHVLPRLTHLQRAKTRLLAEAPPVDEIENKLFRLKTLFTKGLLDDGEFKEQRTRILAQL